MIVDPELRVEHVRAQLVLARRNTRGTVLALRREIATKVDWRTWFAAHPEMFLGGAFFAGFLLARRR